MKTIGLIGGVSWESTRIYYNLINEGIKKKYGAEHSAKIVLISCDFAEIKQLMFADKWPELTGLLMQQAQKLKTAGADYFAICSNTLHRSSLFAQNSGLPFVSICESVSKKVSAKNIQNVMLLGTQVTMQGQFFRDKLVERGIKSVVPSDSDQQIINDIIFSELVKGIFSDHSRLKIVAIIEKLHQMGAEAAILACTELPLLICQQDTPVPLFDTLVEHCNTLIDLA